MCRAPGLDETNQLLHGRPLPASRAQRSRHSNARPRRCSREDAIRAPTRCATDLLRHGTDTCHRPTCSQRRLARTRESAVSAAWAAEERGRGRRDQLRGSGAPRLPRQRHSLNARPRKQSSKGAPECATLQSLSLCSHATRLQAVSTRLPAQEHCSKSSETTRIRQNMHTHHSAKHES